MEAQLTKLEQEAITQLAEKESEAKAQKERKLAAARALEDKRLAAQNKVLNALRRKHRHAVAVIIGNRDHQGRTPDDQYAANNADAVRQFVIDNLGYREGNIIDLRDNFLSGLNAAFGTAGNHKGRLFDYVSPDKSDVIVFYSGHGVPDQHNHLP